MEVLGVSSVEKEYFLIMKVGGKIILYKKVVLIIIGILEIEINISSFKLNFIFNSRMELIY